MDGKQQPQQPSAPDQKIDIGGAPVVANVRFEPDPGGDRPLAYKTLRTIRYRILGIAFGVGLCFLINAFKNTSYDYAYVSNLVVFLISCFVMALHKITSKYNVIITDILCILVLMCTTTMFLSSAMIIPMMNIKFEILTLLTLLSMLTYCLVDRSAHGKWWIIYYIVQMILCGNYMHIVIHDYYNNIHVQFCVICAFIICAVFIVYDIKGILNKYKETDALIATFKLQLDIVLLVLSCYMWIYFHVNKSNLKIK